nr:Chain B, LYS-ILE-LEU-HIS-ARG-LEU-LEU-GLN [synthetic construct]5MMW_B Chain B, LYS-ILE-LEU-HIS-ARG-LEU-LEU-GLN [Homo sapiens]5YP5_B Chain B, SRC2-2 peptide [Homo sapiens]5YP6_B Chain B, SRC2 [Homo sapiens]6E3G_C Chain C, co-activator peptide [Homo sapiens]6E3G_D Chain D, co-activator peptide [Homo sapiens]6J3N_B Chain B, LYS-ILE-LEU-HIS-ARG-LEU-LEU-GLN [synthetic construct]7E3M_B Chain B, LYS-ILE-LEU-HIS-ARG-LEU-LEU-GLN [synthetic construct]
KILHRLLQ